MLSKGTGYTGHSQPAQPEPGPGMLRIGEEELGLLHRSQGRSLVCARVRELRYGKPDGDPDRESHSRPLEDGDGELPDPMFLRVSMKLSVVARTCPR